MADTPETSYIKRGARYIGRTFFNVVEAIDTKCYFTLSASALTILTGIAANYISEESKYANSITYFGKVSLATIISCGYFNYINQIRKNYIIPQLTYIIEARNFCTEAEKYKNIVNQTNDLYTKEIAIMGELINQISACNTEINARSDNLRAEIRELTIRISNSQNEIREVIMALLHAINPIDITARQDEVIAYDQLKLYDGDAIAPETLSIISKVKLQDAKQPVICEKQLYEYKNLVTWHMMPYPNKDAICPHNRNKLIWSNVQRVKR